MCSDCDFKCIWEFILESRVASALNEDMVSILCMKAIFVSLPTEFFKQLSHYVELPNMKTARNDGIAKNLLKMARLKIAKWRNWQKQIKY